MDTDFSEYRLRCQLQGHEDEVRRICVCDNFGIATSSTDETIRFWSLEQSNTTAFTSSKILRGHTSFVGPLAWVSPNEQFPDGVLISGGMDTLVLVWDVATGQNVQMLKGHKMQVTGVSFDGSDIVSASVDCSIRRWKGDQLCEVWEAHKEPIQAVRALPSGELITGSSDNTIKLWKGSKCTHTFTGHTDTVRGLAIMPDFGILSASHDGSIRLWALTGELLLEMVGHTANVYSVDAHKSCLVASGSEDGCAKIWKDGVCVQSIDHPGCVWDAKFLENGDIVTACSDGVVRVWTVHQERTAESHELEAYASLISEYKGSRKRVGGLKLEELPGLEVLQAPGTKEGQTIVVREGDHGVAYAWKDKEQKGEIVNLGSCPSEALMSPDEMLATDLHQLVKTDATKGEFEKVVTLPDDVTEKIIQNHIGCLKSVAMCKSVSKRFGMAASSIKDIALTGDDEDGSSSEKNFRLQSHIGLQKCVGLFQARKFEPLFVGSTCHILLEVDFFSSSDKAISAFKSFQNLNSVSLRFPPFRRNMGEEVGFFWKCDFKQIVNLVIFLSPVKVTPPEGIDTGSVSVLQGFFDEEVDTLSKKLYDDYSHCYADIASRSIIMENLVAALPNLNSVSITGTDQRKIGNIFFKGEKLKAIRLLLQAGDCTWLHRVPVSRTNRMDIPKFVAPNSGYVFSGVRVFVSQFSELDPVIWEELFKSDARGDNESLIEMAYMELLRFVVNNRHLLLEI